MIVNLSPILPTRMTGQTDVAAATSVPSMSGFAAIYAEDSPARFHPDRRTSEEEAEHASADVEENPEWIETASGPGEARTHPSDEVDPGKGANTRPVSDALGPASQTVQWPADSSAPAPLSGSYPPAGPLAEPEPMPPAGSDDGLPAQPRPVLLSSASGPASDRMSPIASAEMGALDEPGQPMRDSAALQTGWSVSENPVVNSPLSRAAQRPEAPPAQPSVQTAALVDMGHRTPVEVHPRVRPGMARLDIGQPLAAHPGLEGATSGTPLIPQHGTALPADDPRFVPHLRSANSAPNQRLTAETGGSGSVPGALPPQTAATHDTDPKRTPLEMPQVLRPNSTAIDKQAGPAKEAKPDQPLETPVRVSAPQETDQPHPTADMKARDRQSLDKPMPQNRPTVTSPGITVAERTLDEVPPPEASPTNRHPGPSTPPAVSERVQDGKGDVQDVSHPRAAPDARHPTSAPGDPPAANRLPFADDTGSGQVRDMTAALPGSPVRADAGAAPAAPPAHQAAATPPGAHPVASQLVDAVLRQPDKPLEITLNPDELGRIRLSVTTTEAATAISVVADRPETLDLIRRHLDQLTLEFRRAGLGQVGIDLGQNSADRPPVEPPRANVSGPDAPPDPAPDTETPLVPGSRIAQTGLDLRL